MKPSAKILFVAAFNAPFVQDDLAVLEKNFLVRRRIGHGIFQLIRIVFSAASADIVFCWFASVYSSLAVLVATFFGIPSVVVVGGVDVAKDKGLGYGIWLSPWKARLVRYALRNAARVLVVDPSLGESARRLAEYEGKNIFYLPTGYDSQYWKPVGVREQRVLTAAVINDARRVRLKGLDIFIDAARTMPEVEFTAVGVKPEVADSLHPPSNVKLLPPVERESLLALYRRSSVYCQASLHEGLSNALCEAMLCGCIPVATDVGGNVTAVGDTGLLVPAGDAAALASAIRIALGMKEENGSKGRARVVALFPKEKRERELVRIVEELTA